MANPNLVSPTTINGIAVHLAATNTMTDVIAAVTASHAYHVESVYAANIHASTVGWVTLVHKSGGTEYELAKQLVVPVAATIELLGGRAIWLQDGDSLRAQANASSNIVINSYYEDIS